jgi:hypothetical protein
LRGRRNRRGRGRGGDRRERNGNNAQQTGATAQEVADDNGEEAQIIGMAIAETPVIAGEIAHEVAVAPTEGLQFREVREVLAPAETFSAPAQEAVVAESSGEQAAPAPVEVAAVTQELEAAPAAVTEAAPAPVVAAPAPRMEEAQQSLFRPVAPAAEYILPEIKPLSTKTEPAPTEIASHTANETAAPDSTEERQHS